MDLLCISTSYRLFLTNLSLGVRSLKARLGKAVIKVLKDYGIGEECVKTVTVDTAAARKAVIVNCTNMEWLTCSAHVIELVIGIFIEYFKTCAKDERRSQLYDPRCILVSILPGIGSPISCCSLPTTTPDP